MIQRLWPDPAPLDDDAVRDAYLPNRSAPALRVNFVMSLDGAVAVDGHSAGLSSEADKLVFGLLRMLADAVLVGAGTLRQEGYRALRVNESRRAWREQHGWAPDPTLVIISSSLDLDPSTPVFTESPVRPVILTHGQAPADRAAAISAVADILTCGESVVDIVAGVRALRTRGLRHILCEGGPLLLGTLIAADLVDELCLTVSPLLVGAGPDRIATGVPSAMARGMRLVHILGAGDMLLTRYIRA